MQRILIVHYHLNSGGVTRIIESQVRSLKEFGKSYDIKILVDSEDTSENSVIRNRNLNYLQAAGSNYQLSYDSLKEFFQKLICDGDILHVHNLNLGKNPILTLVISELAYQGVTVVNHVHDFAEDRSENLILLHRVIEGFFKRDLHSVLYPNIPNYSYIALTSYDLNRLLKNGINRDRLFLLPNPVNSHNTISSEKKMILKKELCNILNIDYSKKLITYPVRVIRRKNIGEFILLASLYYTEANWIVTQAPKNPVELRDYVDWKSFCLQNNIPVIFEAGAIVNFDNLMYVSDMCFTTSIREGFGMVFLEPWTYNIPVLGRSIPQVVSDIENTGVVFPLLYEKFLVNFNHKKTDFADLSVDEQKHYIINSINDRLVQEQLIAENPFLEKLLTSINKKLITINRSIIQEQFSLKNYAKKLERIYQTIAGKSKTGRPYSN